MCTSPPPEEPVPKARQLTVTLRERTLSLSSDNLPAVRRQSRPGEPLPKSKHFAAETGWFMLVSHSFKKMLASSCPKENLVREAWFVPG